MEFTSKISRLCFCGLLFCAFPRVGFGALGGPKNLLGKFYVSNVSGHVICVADGRILELKEGDAVIARGAVVETSPGANVTLVFSNGTGVFTAEKTHFQIEEFDQEFFGPSNNLRVEPSKSSTHVRLAAGRVVISTPRLLNGTVMLYDTPQAEVTVRGDKLLIETSEQQTHVAVIAGESSVNPRDVDGNFVAIGRRLTTGQDIIVTAPRRQNSPSPASAPATASFASGSTAATATVLKLRNSAANDAPQIASSAVRATPTQAAVIAAAAAKSDPAQAVPIVAAVVEALVQLNGGNVPQNAAAVAAAASTSAPGQAGQLCAAVIEVLSTATPRPSPQKLAKDAAILGSTVAAAAPSSAGPLVAALLKTLANASSGSPESFIDAASLLIAAVASTTPAQADAIAAAVAQSWTDAFPNATPAQIAQATGAFAAVLVQAAPSQSAQVLDAIANGTHVAAADVEANARSFADIASAIAPALAQIGQTAAAASLQSTDAGKSLASTALFADTGDTTVANASELPPATSLDASQISLVTASLDAAQAAQSSVQFSTQTAGDGTVTLLPIPTTPANPPNDFVTSPANT